MGDAEIEEATRAALGTVPVIEITPVPRKEGEAAGSKKDDEVVAKDVEESKEENASTTASADGDNGEDEAESESTNEEPPAKEPEAFRPFFVNESLEEETEKTAEVQAGGGGEDCNPLEDGAENPLGEDDNARNPLGEETNNPLGLDYGSGSDDSNSKSETGTTQPESSQPQVPMNEEDKLLATVTCDDAAEEPMDSADNPLGGNPLEKSGENPLGDSERLPLSK